MLWEALFLIKGSVYDIIEALLQVSEGPSKSPVWGTLSALNATRILESKTQFLQYFLKR
jgi:hypothetical protein